MSFFDMLLFDQVFGDGDLGENTVGVLGFFIFVFLGIFAIVKGNKYITDHLIKYLPFFLIGAVILTVILQKMRNRTFTGRILAVANLVNGYIIMISLYHFIKAGGGGFFILGYIHTLEPLGEFFEKSNGFLPILNIPITLIGLILFCVDYTVMPICTIPVIQKIVQKTLLK